MFGIVHYDLKNRGGVNWFRGIQLVYKELRPGTNGGTSNSHVQKEFGDGH
jgi:hypothetical protein